MRKSILKGVVVFTFMLSIISCQKEISEDFDNSLSDITKAKLWFESLSLDNKDLSLGDFEKGNKIKIKPNWNLAGSFKKDGSKFVEVPLLIDGEFGFATEESFKVFKETEDKRFLFSRTNLVIETKSNKKTQGFFMTIIPDKSFNIEQNFDAFNSQYKNWQIGFKGAVLYHRLDGSFSNGWKIHGNGNISKILAKDKLDLPADAGTKNCMAYYLVTWTFTCQESFSVKSNMSCVMTEDWRYLYTECEPQGGGDPGYQSSNLDPLYNENSTLTSSQKSLLESAISEFKHNNPIYAYIWQTLVNNGICIKFIIDPNTPFQAPAYVSANGTTIAFRDEDCITVTALQEELIHRYQMITYGSNFVGIKRNFEFEAKVLQDVLCVKYGGGCPVIGASGFQNEYNITNYSIWILNLAEGYPAQSSVFNSFCQAYFYPQPPNNYCDPNFSPDVLNSFASTGYNIPGGSIMY